MMEGEKRKWKIQDVLKAILAAFKAIIKGEFLLRLNIGKYFIHVVWAFLLLGLFIAFNLGVDTSLAKVEKNKEALKELETQNSDLEFKMESIHRRSSVKDMLEQMGSTLQENEEAVTELKK